MLQLGKQLLNKYLFARLSITVTQPLFESRMNWVFDPAPPASRHATVDYSNTPVNSRDTPVHTSDTPASTIDISASSGAPLASPHPKKSRRRRRRRNRRSANENSAPRSAAPMTPDERWANRNSASQRATQHQSAASDPHPDDEYPSVQRAKLPLLSSATASRSSDQ